MDARRLTTCWPILIAPLALMALQPAPASDLQPALRSLLSRDLGFSPADLTDLEKGKVVTRGLRVSAVGEIGAVGGVRVNTRKEAFGDRYRDIVQFKRGADVLQIGRFSSPPTIDDLAALPLEKQDVDLRS